MDTFFSVTAIYLAITIHEFGHYQAMRTCGLIPRKFMIGIGPRLIKFEFKGTLFDLRPIPFAGAVFYDDEDAEGLTAWQNIYISFWGPFYNLVSMVLAYALIVYLNNDFSWAVVWFWLSNSIGMIWAALTLWIYFLPSVIGDVFSLQWVSEGSNADVLTGELVQGDTWTDWIEWFRLLSFVLAGFNLAPISMLDGGQILRAITEKRFPAFTRWYFRATTALILLIIAMVIFNDLWHVFNSLFG